MMTRSLYWALHESTTFPTSALIAEGVPTAKIMEVQNYYRIAIENLRLANDLTVKIMTPEEGIPNGDL